MNGAAASAHERRRPSMLVPPPGWCSARPILRLQAGLASRASLSIENTAARGIFREDRKILQEGAKEPDVGSFCAVRLSRDGVDGAAGGWITAFPAPRGTSRLARQTICGRSNGHFAWVGLCSIIFAQ